MNDRVLVVGGTGIIGTELVPKLIGAGRSVDVQARTAREGVTIVEDLLAPSEHGHDHGTVVNLAASTRWTMTDSEAHDANIRTAEAMARNAPPDSHVVHISTTFLGPLEFGRGGRRADFRNAYEWSKAESERCVLAHRPDATIVRIPQIVGRRSDGVISSFNGVYSIVRGVCSGLVPVAVGESDAVIDIAPNDDAAAAIADAIDTSSGAHRILSSGPRGLTLGEMVPLVVAELNRFRQDAGAEEIQAVPIVNRETWDRLYWPLAQDFLSAHEQRAIELIMEFSAYTNGFHGAIPTDLVMDPASVLRTAVRSWAERRGRRACGAVREWGVR